MGYKAMETVKSVMSNRGFGINAKKCLCNCTIGIIWGRDMGVL